MLQYSQGSRTMRTGSFIVLSFLLAVIIGCTATVPKQGFLVNGKLSDSQLDELNFNKISIKYEIDYPKERIKSTCTGKSFFETPVELPLGLALKDALSEGLIHTFNISLDNYKYSVFIKISSISPTHEWSGGGSGMDQGSLATKMRVQIVDPKGKTLYDRTQDTQESMDISDRKTFSHPAVIFDELTGKTAVDIVKRISRATNRIEEKSSN
jgi:hypothetical protein